MRQLPRLVRSAALPAAVAVAVLGAGSALAATIGASEPVPESAPVVSASPTESVPAPTESVPAPTESVPAPTESDPAPEEEPTTSTVTCESARNHGEWVSYVARTTPKGADRADAIREAAQSDCGKKGDDEADESEESDTESSQKPERGSKADQAEGKGNGNGKPDRTDDGQTDGSTDDAPVVTEPTEDGAGENPVEGQG